METLKPRIALTFADNGRNGGPNMSHNRIMQSILRDKYDFIAINVPRIRELIKISGMRRLISQIKNSNCDIVHLGGLQLSGFFIMLACKVAKVQRTVVAVHGSSTEAMKISRFDREIYKIAEDFTLRNASVHYGVSEYILKSPRIQKFRNKSFGCIYNMSPELTHENSGISFREEFGIAEDVIIIASIARIVEEKGYAYLVQAIDRLSDREKIKFVIVGQGSYLVTMKRLIKKLGIEDKVLFVGFRTDIMRILEDTDIVVIPSLHETLSISLIEAGLMGIPSVATNVGGIPEVVEDKKSGLLIPPADDKAIADAIAFLLDNHAIRSEMGKEARRIVEEKFDPNTIAKQIDQLYTELLKSKSSE